MVDFPYVKVITRGFIPQSQVCTLYPHGVPPAPWNPPWPTWLPWNALDPTRRAHPRRAPPERWGAFFWTGKCWKMLEKWWKMMEHECKILEKWWKNDCNMVGKWRNSGYNSTKNAGEKMINRGPNRSSREKSQAILVLSHVKKPPIRQSRGLEGSVEIQ